MGFLIHELFHRNIAFLKMNHDVHEAIIDFETLRILEKIDPKWGEVYNSKLQEIKKSDFLKLVPSGIRSGTVTIDECIKKATD